MTDNLKLIDRRGFLYGSGMAALAAAPGLAGAAAESGDHKHHEGKYGALIAEAIHCIETGDACAACANECKRIV